MVPQRLVMRNYAGKLPVRIKYQNLLSFKEGMIHLCQSILETRQMSHLHGSSTFAIPLRTPFAFRVSRNHFLQVLAKNEESFVIEKKITEPLIAKNKRLSLNTLETSITLNLFRIVQFISVTMSI